MNTTSPHDRRQRRLLLGLAAMFFVPLALSFYLYYGHHTWRPVGHTNAGELVDPPRPLPEGALPLLDSTQATAPGFLRGKWTLLYVQPGACDEACGTRLYDTRQVRIALDREMHRVQRVLLADAHCCDFAALREAHPDLIEVDSGAAAQALLKQLPTREPRTYIVDPLGNLMMVYAPGAKPKGMLEDMKRLLRLSSIG
jgi:cytochrome oxidase Cu insertion factor (SCO1/SenC/PrrC family)